MSNKEVLRLIFLGLLIGLNIGLTEVCKEKDKMINLLGRIKSPQIEPQSEVPKNLPIVQFK